MISDSDIALSSSYDKSRKIAKNAIDIVGLLSIVVGLPKVSRGTRGAFEMDADYYLKELIGQGTSDNIQRTVFPSPRSINQNFAALLIEILLQEASFLSKLSEQTIQQQVSSLIPSSIKYFQTFLPIKKLNWSDQYYFDIYLYNLYVVIAKLLPRSEDRVNLQEQFGRKVLHRIFIDDLLQSPTTLNQLKNTSPDKIYQTLKDLLEFFRKTGMVGSYQLEADKLQDQEELQSFFHDPDSYLNFQVTIERPVSLIGFLQQSATNSLFHPNIVAYILQAYLNSPGVKASFEDYLLDNFYTENNTILQAQDIVIAFTLTRS